MSGASLRVEISDAHARDRLGELVARISNEEAFLRDVGQHLFNSVQDNFHKERAPDGTPWEPLKPATLKARKRAKRSPAGILRASGRMYGSLAFQVSNGEVRVGVSTPADRNYAVTHQFGATIRKPERQGQIWRHFSPTKGFGNRFTKKRLKTSKPTDVTIGEHTVTVPARPFLGVSVDDQIEIVNIVERWLFE